MLLRNLSNFDLLSGLKKLVSQEREILTEILHHLLEVEDRKLHLHEGYGSLFQYAVEALGYSEAQAYRRISAMRLLKELPEIEEPLKTGSLNLTHLTQAREYFKSEDKKAKTSSTEAVKNDHVAQGMPSNEVLTREDKLSILQSLENKTTRETEKLFAGLAPDSIPSDKERPIRENLTEIRFVASDLLLEKLKKFKNLDSHTQKDPNYAELFERLVDLALKQKEPSKPKVKKTAPHDTVTHEAIAHKTEEPFSAPKKSVGLRSRTIPVSVKRTVLTRDQVSCDFKNPVTGKRCGSKFKLQFDHRIPFAKGGEHSVNNIRMLCQNHNLLHAEKSFGKEKMKMYQRQI